MSWGYGAMGDIAVGVRVTDSGPTHACDELIHGYKCILDFDVGLKYYSEDMRVGIGLYSDS